jgi:hypothetical protein
LQVIQSQVITGDGQTVNVSGTGVVSIADGGVDTPQLADGAATAPKVGFGVVFRKPWRANWRTEALSRAATRYYAPDGRSAPSNDSDQRSAMLVTEPGTLKNFRAKVVQAGGTNLAATETMTLTLMRNGVATAIALVFATLALDTEVTTVATLAVVAGDYLCWRETSVNTDGLEQCDLAVSFDHEVGL